MQIAAFRQRDELLYDGTKILRLIERRDDLLVLDESLGEIHEHRLAVLMRAAETALLVTMVHVALLRSCGRRAKVRPGFGSREIGSWQSFKSDCPLPTADFRS
jgi:hypothetical protein